MSNEEQVLFWRELEKYMRNAPSHRFGQAVFNVMHFLHPEKANALRGGEHDPFHDTERVGEFLSRCFGDDK